MVNQILRVLMLFSAMFVVQPPLYAQPGSPLVSDVIGIECQGDSTYAFKFDVDVQVPSGEGDDQTYAIQVKAKIGTLGLKPLWSIVPAVDDDNTIVADGGDSLTFTDVAVLVNDTAASYDGHNGADGPEGGYVTSNHPSVVLNVILVKSDGSGGWTPVTEPGDEWIEYETPTDDTVPYQEVEDLGW